MTADLGIYALDGHECPWQKSLPLEVSSCLTLPPHPVLPRLAAASGQRNLRLPWGCHCARFKTWQSAV